MARRRVVQDPYAIRFERLVPTPDDWAPAVFVPECFTSDPTHETPQDESNYAWEGEAPRGAFERYRGRHDEATRNPLVAGAYVHGWVTRYLQPDLEGRFQVRVVFWGDDDTGMERDIFVHGEQPAIEVYQRMIGWMCGLAFVSKAILQVNGFKFG